MMSVSIYAPATLTAKQNAHLTNPTNSVESVHGTVSLPPAIGHPRDIMKKEVMLNQVAKKSRVIGFCREKNAEKRGSFFSISFILHGEQGVNLTNIIITR